MATNIADHLLKLMYSVSEGTFFPTNTLVCSKGEMVKLFHTSYFIHIFTVIFRFIEIISILAR